MAISVAACTVACGDDGSRGPEGGPDESDGTAAGEGGPGLARAHERVVIFMAAGEDGGEPPDVASVALFHTTVGEEGEDRWSRAWKAREGEWTALLDHRTSTGPTRSPWQILPGGGVRVISGFDDSVETLILAGEEGAVEISYGGLRTEWEGGRGDRYRLHRAAAVAGGEEEARDGWLVDGVLRGTPSGSDEFHAFLAGDDDLGMVLKIQGAEGDRTGRAWTRADFRDQRWVDLDLRPDPGEEGGAVPESWSFNTASEELSGRLDVGAMDRQEAGSDGADPVFALSGTIRLDGRERPVHGVLVHRRP